MAEGDTPKEKFPPEITLSDDTPKKGQYTLSLTIPEMKTKKKSVFSSVAEVTNGECKVQVDTEKMEITARIDVKGTQNHYRYEKNLPEKVKKAEHKLKDEEVILTFTKDGDVSMGQYTDYFRRKP